MSADTHTPGPWHFDGKSRIDALAFRTPSTYTDDSGQEQVYMTGLVALPYACGGSGTHRLNALLIAAAPDLLSALQGVLRVADRKTDEFDAARAAIAKATGSES